MSQDIQAKTEFFHTMSALWKSLQRAGDHWSKDIFCADTPTGKKVVLYLTSELPPKSGKYVAAYITMFLAEHGWTARVVVRRHYVRLALSRT